jgi:hypothetical protein
VGEGELESWLEELLDVWPPDVLLLFNLGDSEDLDIPKSGSVSGSHVLVHGLDGLGSGKSSEFLDHLQISSSIFHRCIQHTLWVPDRESYRSQMAKFLTFKGFFSWIYDMSMILPNVPKSTYDVQSDNLSASLLDLLQLSEVVPESRLGDNIVGRKDPHSAVPSVSTLYVSVYSHSLELGVLVRLRGQLSPDDRVLGESGHL